MSTYLVALAIGDWQCLERTVDGTPIRVCAEPDKKQYGQFALEAAAQSVHFYNQWYGIKYPFEKLDMLAIPDYEWGGMENTASIFYRDTALLMDEKTASVFSKRGHATVVAHEIAHQWFGDLVTAAWWDDIWLNEGFATWMARKPIRAWHPEWHLEDDEAATAQGVIGQDSLSAARAIHGDPRTSAEIKEMFDGITYAKRRGRSGHVGVLCGAGSLPQWRECLSESACQWQCHLGGFLAGCGQGLWQARG